MNNKQRKKFWEKLCTLKGENIEKEIHELNSTIIYPSKLYRYRPLSISSVDALLHNKLYFSTADYYDDPFDTFINVRISEIVPTIKIINSASDEEIYNFINNVMASFGLNPLLIEDLQSIKEYLKFSVKSKEFVDDFKQFVRNIRNELKKEIWSVCFSETAINDNLWLKYADAHKGFVIEYDLNDFNNILCGKQEKCLNCAINKFGTCLYPMYYSNKRYDATKFAQYKMACKLTGYNMHQNLYQGIVNIFGNQTWESEKITLIKDYCHRFDREWRMIIPINMNPPVMREWIPSAVYLGLNMDNGNRKMISDIANHAGIKRIAECYITDSGKLSTRLWRNK